MTSTLRDQISQCLTLAHRDIWVSWQRAGYHQYPAAAELPQLSDVSYLAHRHRHLFKFQVSIQVFHNDRELEFHQVLRFCESLFDSREIDINHKSVEMLADDVYTRLAERYGTHRRISVEVSEDGECGCVIHYPAQTYLV